MSLLLYRGLTAAASPLVRSHLAKRARRGKEDPARLDERFGVASTARPPGRLIWIHAASVGESLSMLSVVDRLLADRPGLNIIITTGTVTSARLLGERAPKGVIHQFVPLDRAAWARRFLDHWRPDAVLWVESEFWPNILGEIGARKIPAVLINARVSPRSFDGWRRLPGVIRRVLANFELCLAQTDADAEKLRRLGAARVKCPGNLKFAAPPLPADDAALEALKATIGDRPTWLAASTHPGEELMIAGAHALIRRGHPDALAIIVPRHPARGADIAAELRGSGATVGLRSAGDTPAPKTDIYIADTMGELGIYYRLARAAFLGGSLIPHGGQNLLEAANLGCPVVHGPHMTNFRAIADEMSAAGATAVAENIDSLAAEITRLLENSEEHAGRVSAARRVASSKQGILDAVIDELTPYLDPGTDHAGT